MKLEITESGVFVDGSKEPAKVGSIVDLKGDKIPPYLVNKCRIVTATKKLEVATPKAVPKATK